MFEFFRCLFSWFPFSRRRHTFAAITGKIGEDAAVKFLKKQAGMKIARRKFRNAHTEIDIIAVDGETMVFVEVKTRASNARVDGYYAAVARKKRDAVRKCAMAYMSTLISKPKTWRFDVVDIKLDDKLKIVSISHFENAFF